MFRFALIVLISAITFCTVVSPVIAREPEGTPVVRESEAARAARKAAAQRKRRIIMNNDGNDARGIKEGEEKTVASFLERRTLPLIGSQVDAIFYCSGVFNLYTHKSEETELRGHGDKEALDWAWELTKLGTDSLTVITEFAHENGMEAFWSMRMNDTHDSGDDALLCRWKQEHPDYLMGKKGDKFPHGGGRWSAVNYGLPEVREKVFRILRDVATRYDVDGLELDFYRHPVYFKPQMTGEPVTQEHCDMMTGLLRRLRAMTVEVAEKRGRPLLIAVRVPDSTGFARAIGLDYEQWLKEDLIDILTGTGYFHFEPWENLVNVGHQYGVPVYACLSGSQVVSSKNPEGGRPELMPLWHGEAAQAWQADEDGIYTFNVFNPRDELFRTLGSLETLMKLPAPHKAITGEKKAMQRWLKGGSSFVTLSEP